MAEYRSLLREVAYPNAGGRVWTHSGGPGSLGLALRCRIGGVVEPRIQYAKTSDGVNMAYCLMGENPGVAAGGERPLRGGAGDAGTARADREASGHGCEPRRCAGGSSRARIALMSCPVCFRWVPRSMARRTSALRWNA